MPSGKSLPTLSAKSSSYAESPLGQIVSDALKKIAELKTKYPPEPSGTDSKEKMDAEKLVNVIESVLKILNKNILPNFDHGNIPGFFTLSKMALNIPKLQSLIESLYTREDALLQSIAEIMPEIVAAAKKSNQTLSTSIVDLLELNKEKLFKVAEKIPSTTELNDLLTDFKEKIRSLDGLASLRNMDNLALSNHILEDLQLSVTSPRHPMTYELMQIMAQVIQAVPEKIEETIPFLDPLAAPTILQSGVVGALINKFLSFKLEHIKYDDSEHSVYTYKLTIADKTTILDMQAFYKASQAQLLNQWIVPAIWRYLAIYGTPHAEFEPARSVIKQGITQMESELARSTVLQQLTKIECNSIHDAVSSHLQVFNQIIQINAIPTLTHTDEVMQNIKRCKELLLSNHQVRDFLAQKIASYAFTPALDLLRGEPMSSLAALCQEHQKKGLDVAYWNLPLPDKLNCANPGPHANGGRVIDIRKELESYITNTLKQLQSDEEFIVSDINKYSKEAIEGWKEAYRIHMQTLQGFEQQFDLFNSPSIDQRHITSLESELDSLLEKSRKQQTLQQKVTDFIATVEKPIAFDLDAQLQSELEAEISSLTQAAESFIQKLHLAQQTLNREQQVLQTQLDKNKSEARCPENLVFANPENVQQMLSSTEHNLDKIQKRKYTLKTRAETIQASILSQHEALADVTLHEQQKRVELAHLQKLIDSHQSTFESLSEKQYDVSTETAQLFETSATPLRLLYEVQGILQNSAKTKKIPFKKLDLIMATKDKSKYEPSGFEKLLTFLDENLSIEDWKKYRHCQEDIFKHNPSNEDFVRMYNTLWSAIEVKMEKIDTRLKAHHHLQAEKKDDQQTSSALHLQRNINDAIKATIESERLSLQLQSQEISLSISHLSEESQTITLDIKALEIEEQEDENNRLVVTQFIQILSDIKQFESQVELLENNPNDTDLFQHVSELKFVDSLVNEKAREVTRAIEALKDPAIHTKNIMAIMQLLVPLNQQIARVVEERLTAQVTRLENLILDDHRNYLDLLRMSSATNQEERCANLDRCQLLSDSVQIHVDALQTLTDTVINHAPKSSITVRINEIRRQLLHADKLTSLRKTHNQIGFIHVKIDTRPPLTCTVRSLPQIEAVADTDLFQQENIRITMVKGLVLKLDTYLQMRKEQYKIKDFFTSKDSEAHIQFIKGLKQQLATYQHSGNSQVILQTIRDNIARFPGVKFQPLLNKVIASILDYEDNILANNSVDEANTSQEKIGYLLKTMRSKNPDFVAKLEILYKKIDSMQSYGVKLTQKEDKCGEVVTRLSQELRADANRFTITCSKGTPNIADDEKFREKFAARLHSEDDIMLKHSKKWDQIIASIAHALLFIPLFIHSKLTTTRCMFFFDRTTKMEIIESIEKSTVGLIRASN